MICLKKTDTFAFVDAFGWEIYKKYGFLDDVIIDAKPLETTFGFSSGADPSILTGRYPDEHHHWSCFNYNPDESPFKPFKYFSFLPPIIFERARVRHWLSKAFSKFKSYTGYFELYSVPFAHLPYFDYLEKKDYFVRGDYQPDISSIGVLIIIFPITAPIGVILKMTF